MDCSLPPILPPTMDDEEYLDHLFDAVVDALDAGRDPSPEALSSERPHLQARIEALVGLARRIRPTDGRALPAVPGYEIIEEIGSGGMGTVFLARQRALGGRVVALKVLPTGAALSPKARQRFRAEASAIASVRHPNIVAVHDVVSSDGILAYAMEWIDGASLAEWIREQGSAARRVGFACRVGISIARALAAVHAAGLLHRDVKPANILLRRDGTPMLGDFGLVQPIERGVTQTGHFSGTMRYASPEQLRGDRAAIDRRSDIFSLGATLHHLLAGGPPFGDEPLTEHLRRVEAGATPLRRVEQGIPRDLETIVATAMEADPARRYGSADELADDLERFLDLKPIRARPAGPVTHALKLVRRRRGSLVAASVGGAVMAIALVAVGVSLFLAPMWSSEALREARLALLDPGQATNITSAILWGRTNPSPEAVVAARRAAGERALRHYDAARLWSPFDAAIRDERTVVAAAAIGEEPQWRDARSEGLHAFVIADGVRASEAWSRHLAERDPLDAADPLVEAGLGIIHLFEGEPQRAYPRLRLACKAFPSVGFLAIYHAEAAARCGDVEIAERLLEASAAMPRGSATATERVLAILRAAQGRDAEAELLFRRRTSAVLLLDYAEFLRSRGRHEEALDEMLFVFGGARGRRVAAAFMATAEAWWTSLSGLERARQLRSLVLDPYAPSSLGTVLRAYRDAAGIDVSERGPDRGRRDDLQNRGDSAAVGEGASSSSSVSVAPGSELASQLEARIMWLCGTTESNPRLVRLVRAAAVGWGSSRRVRGAVLAAAAVPLQSAPVFAEEGMAAARIKNDASTSAYLRIADSPGLEPAFFTIECRITPRGPGFGGTADQFGSSIIAKPMEGLGGITLSSYTLQWSPVTNRLRVGVAEALPGSAPQLTSSGTVPLNTTAHIAFTRDGSMLHLYIDGVLDSSMAAPWAVAYGNQDVLIGAGNYCCGFLRRFDGEIDDVRIWNHARSASEIAAGMDQEVTGPMPGLLAAWNFNCGDYRDVSGNGHAATPIGSVPFVAQDRDLVTPPLAVAHAGEDQSATEGSTVQLDGGASTATCGSPGYLWTQLTGPSVELIDADTATPTFTAPSIAKGAVELVFELVVTDGAFASEPDSVVVEVTNPTGCAADLNGDGLVDGADLGIVLGGWGGAGAGDITGDGVVDGADLGVLLGAWGPC